MRGRILAHNTPTLMADKPKILHAAASNFMLFDSLHFAIEVAMKGHVSKVWLIR